VKIFLQVDEGGESDRDPSFLMWFAGHMLVIFSHILKEETEAFGFKHI
jgi:hypothetical protein